MNLVKKLDYIFKSQSSNLLYYTKQNVAMFVFALQCSFLEKYVHQTQIKIEKYCSFDII